MLYGGRIPMNEAEEAAYDQLIEQYGGENVRGITRRDPGNTGPLHVELSGGQVCEIADDGQVTEINV